MKEKTPVLFVGHGSPMNAIGDNPSRKAWREMGAKLGKPTAIVAVSAHWTTQGVCVRRADDNPQIYDMYGFPQELYDVKYEPRGSVELADKVLQLVKGARADNTWGMDHGAWSVLCNMYPDADMPVVMMSVDAMANPERLFETGQQLASLRDEGVMIVCSGNVVHNLRMVNWRMRNGFDWADKFDEAIKQLIQDHRWHEVVEYRQLNDNRMAIPTTEHFYPLLVALGAASPTDPITVWNEYRELGSMSMTSYVFG